VIAKAVIPSLDPARMKAKAIPSDAGEPVVVDCQGHSVSASWEGRKPRPAGTVRVLDRQSLPEGREAVWLATAEDIGACSAVDGYGFFAIVALDGPRLAVLGVSPWYPSCGFKRKLRVEKLENETVYVDSDGFSSGAGPTEWEGVWLLRDGQLIRAGRYITYEAPDPGTGMVDDAGLEGPQFRGSARYESHGIVLAGENSWLRRVETDVGPDYVVAKKAPVTRRYQIRGNVLVDEKGLPADKLWVR
jgi:hypothetical protein